MNIRKNANWIFKKINNSFKYSKKAGEKVADVPAFSLFVGVSKEKLARKPGYSAQFNGKFLSLTKTHTLKWVNCIEDVRINPLVEPNPHIVIVGMSGFGKSTLFKSFIVDINNAKRNAIVFDAHSEHAAVVRSLGGNAYNAAFYGINVFDLNGATVGDRIASLKDLFKEVYSLGHIQETKLADCLWYTYRKFGVGSKHDTKIKSLPTIADLIDELSIFIKNSDTASEKNTLQHLRDKISLLNTVAFTRNFVSIDSLKHGVNSFSLAELKNREAQIIYINELLRRLYSTMKEHEKEKGVALYIMLDEAQFLINSSQSGGETISKLISEGRKYGVGVIIATHMANVLDKRVVSNAATFITFYAREPTEINYVSNVLSGGDPQRGFFIKQKLMNLNRNVAIVMSDFVKNPVVVNTPRFDDIGVTDIADTTDIKDKLLFLCRRPVLYNELKYDDKIIRGLIDAHELETMQTDFMGRQETWVMKRNGAFSIEHEVWVRKIRDYIAALGVNVYIVNSANGPDVVVYSKGAKYAIEYETGRKDLKSTKQMIDKRLSQFTKIVVVVNEASYDAYKKELERPRVLVITLKELEKLKELLGVVS